MKTIRTIAAAAAGALCLAAPSTALVQGQAQPQGQAQTQINISDAEAERFVATAQAVQEVALSYQGRIEQAETREQASAIAQEGRSAIRAAIQDNGMQIERYQEIVRAAQNDPELMATLNARMEANGGQ